MDKTQLRDHFAGLVLQAMIGLGDKIHYGREDENIVDKINWVGWGEKPSEGGESLAETLSYDAYCVADAMIRSKAEFDRDRPL